MANNVSDSSIGFDSDLNEITVLGHQLCKKFPKSSKQNLARNLVAVIAERLIAQDLWISYKLKLLTKKIGSEIPLPSFSTSGSAGMDLRACLDDQIRIGSGETELIPSGIAIYIEDPNYAGLILPRSGLGHKNGIVLGNLVGLIDSDYQGELMISLWNRSERAFVLAPGDRVAQLILIPVKQLPLIVVDEFDTSERGGKGFGSSGIN